MHLQRRGDEHHDWSLYRGDGSVGIEWYFRELTKLETSVMLYHLEPGASEGSHFHLEGDPESCSVDSEDELGTLLTSTTQTTDIVRQVSAASGDQSQGIEQVNVAMRAVDGVTGRNSAAAEDLAATAQEMAAQAEALRDAVEFFRLAEDEALLAGAGAVA